jgi:epoxyqueuosine reductase
VVLDFVVQAMLTSEAIKARAYDLGFDLCGIAPAEDHAELRFLDEWIAARYYGTMTWLPRTARVRRDVRQIIPSARSVILTGTLYNADRPYSSAQPAPETAHVSRYAWGDDYHTVIGQRLEALLAWMRDAHDAPFEARAYTDTGPVQERVYAQHAGLGWIGKNTCLINEGLGSWLFLGAIVCSLPLTTDAPAVDRCGSCQLCLQSCPTGAIIEPRVLDARLCISYLTIEKRGMMPDGEVRGEIGTRVYGCDVCQEVCPWNSRPVASARPEWQPQEALDAPTLLALWKATDAELDAIRMRGPMSRVSTQGLRRNLAIAIGNANGAVPPAALDVTEGRPARPSLDDPAVLDAIAWARARLGHQDDRVMETSVGAGRIINP